MYRRISSKKKYRPPRLSVVVGSTSDWAAGQTAHIPGAPGPHAVIWTSRPGTGQRSTLNLGLTPLIRTTIGTMPIYSCMGDRRGLSNTLSQMANGMPIVIAMAETCGTVSGQNLRSPPYTDPSGSYPVFVGHGSVLHGYI